MKKETIVLQDEIIGLNKELKESVEKSKDVVVRRVEEVSRCASYPPPHQFDYPPIILSRIGPVRHVPEDDGQLPGGAAAA
ncbi:hypothetical protein EON65_40045 [archaeon]|nr:MAG: hypothetical protein EON65_40045 [archaeon]